MPPFPGTPGDDIIYGTEDADLIEGFGGNDHLFGFGGDDTIDGGDGSDIIYGGTGADTMTGGIGNDYYEVDNAGDLVIEALNGGSDLVFTKIDYTLPDNVERLAAFDASSTTPLTLTGNALNNEIIGNEGANLLIGGGGTDLLRGAGGDDTYIVDSASDVVGEAAGGGTDRIFFAGVTSSSLHSGFDYSLLRTEFENPLPAGNQNTTIEHLGVYDQFSTNSVNLRGSIVDDLLTGNEGINVFEGQAGNDTMIGYGGDDYYFVGETADVVIEQSGGGYDTVFLGRYFPRVFNTASPSVISYTLPDGVERLAADHVVSFDTPGLNRDLPQYTLIGNALNNEISGNDVANVINGGAGNDILIGYGGLDTFVFNTPLAAGNVDQIVDFSAGAEKIHLDDAVFLGLTPGALPAGAFAMGTAAQDADDRILYDSSTGNLYFDSDGTGAASPILFAVVHEGLNVTANDFVVI